MVVALSADKIKLGVVEARFILILYPVALLVLTVKTLEVETGVPGVIVLTNETALVSTVKVKVGAAAAVVICGIWV